MANIAFAKEKKTDFQSKKVVYKLLVVDDDQSIHDITNMAVKAMQFSDFELEVYSAYNAPEARIMLEQNSDIALALIDVVMDTPEAGLELVNFIRHNLQNQLIRLIIRTGQANDFPQMHVIQHYDINDFKEKTELTLEKLYTAIRTSIKQYEQLSELQNKYEEIYRQMTTNPLTKLPNRAKLIEDFSHKTHQTLILIDIIGFSIINDSNGYDVGDFVLKELGGFLSVMYSEKFKIYHLNSDVFALVTTVDRIDNLVATVQKIKEDISKLHIVTDNFNKTIDTTIGVAFQTEDDVIRKAELALKEARNTGKNQIKVYSSDLKIIQQINDTNYWAPIIKKALENDGLIAYAQPIHRIDDKSIDKYELLIRLKDENIIYEPVHFLNAASKSGQLYNIFKFMFEQGCMYALKTGQRYSINISDCESQNDGLFDFIESTINKYGVDPTLLSLEILEYNSISNSQDIRDTLNKVHGLGIELIVDDFGTQCSNFGQAKQLPVSTLKIDGSYIKNIHESVDSQIIVKTIQTFAREKGLKLVAEFVCDEKVYEKVKSMGIEYVQGFYLSEPKPLSEV